jgi:hypothetical protein
MLAAPAHACNNWLHEDSTLSDKLNLYIEASKQVVLHNTCQNKYKA